MKILILAPYPLKCAPSQRFRFEHFLTHLPQKGINWDFQSFLSEHGWGLLYKRGHTLAKAWMVAGGFLRRLGILFRIPSYDLIFIHREVSPLGPPVFEFIIAKILRKKIIYDFDDAIWMADQAEEHWLWQLAKCRSKVSKICAWSLKVSAGNAFLAKYALTHCSHVCIIPTVVNTEVHKPAYAQQDKDRLTIGWTGSHSTLFYLDELLPILQDLEQSFSFNFLVIANKNPNLDLKHFLFIKWEEANEISDLSRIDIGVMPLQGSEWAKGKCGFKLIQYMSLGVAAVAAPVGVNSDIIEHNHSGLIASTDEEWYACLAQLLKDEALRRNLGNAGREMIETNYSVRSQASNFLNLFKNRS